MAAGAVSGSERLGTLGVGRTVALIGSGPGSGSRRRRFPPAVTQNRDRGVVEAVTGSECLGTVAAVGAVALTDS